MRYIVNVRDLRQRGYVVRSSPPPVAFSVLPRGGILHKTPSRFWVEPSSERVPFDLARLFELAERAQSAKKTLLLAPRRRRVGPHLLPRPVGPRRPGSMSPLHLAGPAVGWVTEDRVVVFDQPGGRGPAGGGPACMAVG